jgi:hypothetical protein
MIKRLALLVLSLSLVGTAVADEGMWLLNKVPVDKIKAKYGFEVTQQWLDNVRLGSVRFNNGGSGSFVSADGLAFTNHHVGRVCLQDLSTKDKDYIKNGFYAKTQAEEAKCPDLELNVLKEIEDVTAQVQGAAKPGMSVAQAGQAQRQAASQIEAECAKKSGLRCDVVTLFAGGMYHLYKYKKYTDVRLVFAPEGPMAFFGGDHDNFEFPRYDLDITFFRVYENDKPVRLDNYLKFSKTGVKAGDLVFVSGHPGSTQRLMTMKQLEFLRDFQTPQSIEFLTRRAKLLHAFSDQSPENARIAADDLFGIENSLKANIGRFGGLKDAQLMGKKASEEAALRKKTNADPKLKAEYGSVWDDIAATVAKQKDAFFPYMYVERLRGFGGTMPAYARALVRVTAEKQKPNAERLREYGESRLPSFEQSLFSTAPVYKSLDVLLLTDSLKDLQSKLGANNPIVQKALGGKTPEEAAKTLIENSKLDDPAVRKQLYEGGVEAIAASSDPLIVLMREIDPAAREVRKQWDDEIDAPLRINSTRLAKARFAAQGTNTYPDATFTLRLSYGTIQGYTEDGQGNVAPKGSIVQPFTVMGGAYTHAAKNGNKGDFELPKSWIEAKSKINPNTKFNFVSTADIIGGNSGSPTVDKKGEVVGIIFDGNIQSLPGDFAYDDRYNRAVSVDSRGIIESLRKIYNANALADELVGKQEAAPAKKPAPGKKAVAGKKA